MRAGLDEDRVMEMDCPELLEAAAKELAKELTGDTQAAPPPDKAGSVESGTDSATFHALELEIEEKRWLREERKAEREAQEKRAERELELRKAEVELQRTKLEKEAELQRAKLEKEAEKETKRIELEQAKLALEMRKIEAVAMGADLGDVEGQESTDEPHPRAGRVGSTPLPKPNVTGTL